MSGNENVMAVLTGLALLSFVGNLIIVIARATKKRREEAERLDREAFHAMRDSEALRGLLKRGVLTEDQVKSHCPFWRAAP